LFSRSHCQAWQSPARHPCPRRTRLKLSRFTPEQHARLDEYEADQERLTFLWSELNPCEMYPDVKALTPEETQAIETEMKTISKKWAPPEQSMEETPHAD
jgi:hypothetical protein